MKAIFATPWLVQIPGRDDYLIYPPDEPSADIMPYAKLIGMHVDSLKMILPHNGLVRGTLETEDPVIINALLKVRGGIIKRLQVPDDVPETPKPDEDKEQENLAAHGYVSVQVGPHGEVDWALMDVDRLQSFCDEHGLVAPDRRINIEKQRKFVKSQWDKKLKAEKKKKKEDK